MLKSKIDMFNEAKDKLKSNKISKTSLFTYLKPILKPILSIEELNGILIQAGEEIEDEGVPQFLYQFFKIKKY